MNLLALFSTFSLLQCITQIGSWNTLERYLERDLANVALGSSGRFRSLR
jgi:hypothetical protein